MLRIIKQRDREQSTLLYCCIDFTPWILCAVFVLPSENDLEKSNNDNQDTEHLLQKEKLGFSSSDWQEMTVGNIKKVYKTMSTQKGRDYRALNKLAIGKLKNNTKKLSFFVQYLARLQIYSLQNIAQLEFYRDSGGSCPGSQITTDSYQIHRNHTWFRMSWSTRTGRVFVCVCVRKHHMQLLCFYTLP